MLEDEDGASEHLHVILTSPSLAGEVVTVSISTHRPKSETLVCLKVGEHDFITRPSVCPYRFAKIRSVASIVAAIEEGYARKHNPASEALIAKLASGLLDSDFAPPGIRAFYFGSDSHLAILVPTALRTTFKLTHYQDLGVGVEDFDG